MNKYDHMKFKRTITFYSSKQLIYVIHTHQLGSMKASELVTCTVYTLMITSKMFLSTYVFNDFVTFKCSKPDRHADLHLVKK